MKISICDKCGLQTKIKHKICPLCHNKMRRSKPQNIIKANTFNTNRDVEIFYTCIKCKSHVRNKICLKCNKVGLLTISYHQKTHIIKKLNSLFDIFTDVEVKEIVSQLSEAEKDLIYREFASTNAILNKRDPLKASVCFFVALLIYLMCLSIAFNYQEKEIIISYVSNAFANATFSVFTFLGIFYLFDAQRVEKDLIAGKIGLISGVMHFIYLLLLILINPNFLSGLIYGFIIIGITIIITFLKTIKRR